KMPSCSAINCVNRTGGSDGKGMLPNKNSRLCGSHFAEECFVITGGKKHLRLTAVPTIFDFSLKGKRMTAQEKPGNDASTTPITAGKDNTCSHRDHEPERIKEHNYTVSRSPKSIKRQMETQLISVEEKLDHCRKKLKTEQLKTRRLKKQVNSLSEVISELKDKSLISTGCDNKCLFGYGQSIHWRWKSSQEKAFIAIVPSYKAV
uniref:THAP-type domain-containing protein n=1 Tax=Neogobius melanostomus TaxID=47308 RepID=A0A8C6SWS5_9GOBI